MVAFHFILLLSNSHSVGRNVYPGTDMRPSQGKHQKVRERNRDGGSRYATKNVSAASHPIRRGSRRLPAWVGVK
jgi:hypothetical protein